MTNAPLWPWNWHSRGMSSKMSWRLRYIFGIPPLILVLVPVSSSSNCERKALNRESEDYVNVLLPGINRLKNLSHAEVTAHVSSSCRGREPNWLKKLSCSDSEEGMYLYLCQVACKMLQIAKANISEALNQQLSFVSRDTIDILCCNCPQVREKLRKTERERETEDSSLNEPYPTRSVGKDKGPRKGRRKQNPELRCFLEKALSEFIICWQKRYSTTSRFG
ncbi:interleukin-7 [Tachyglossus aculeatus]|uniref:interleukin-7 n=1 Tax=Tachyglossus aculeatus TaxID=9261 RepID=UPI0018F32AAA|nr:interleukin-7 [Tachyglossus aculeatus]